LLATQPRFRRVLTQKIFTWDLQPLYIYADYLLSNKDANI
jgi:hypothetical protein